MRSLLAGLVIAALLALAAGPAAAQMEREDLPEFGVEFDWPHDGQLLDLFDRGDNPFGPQHTGVDVAADPGDEVRAVADGVVTWAGHVGWNGWVTIEHQPQLVSTVGSMASYAVETGDQVTRGQVVGTTSADLHDGVSRLHIGFRWQGEYLDPLWLLPPPNAPDPTLLGSGEWLADEAPYIPTYDDWTGEHRWGIVPDSPEATHPGWVFPPNLNHVVGVAGLESMSGSTPIVLEHLGYEREDITYLSYEGRIIPGPLDPDDPERDQLPYDGEDTWSGVAEAARRLKEQLQAQWAANPGQAVDLVGHSMGGLVILYYMAVHHDVMDPTLPPIGHVATFASPIQGVAAADEFQDVKNSIMGFTLDWLEWAGAGAPNSQAMEDVAQGSAVVDTIAEMWEGAMENWLRGPLVDTQVATFGGQWDLVVPEHASNLPGGQHAVLPGGHINMRDTEAARIALRAFLANQPIPGEAGGVGHLASYGIDWLGRLAVDTIFQPCLLCEL